MHVRRPVDGTRQHGFAEPEQMRHAEMMAETEKLRTALLTSISALASLIEGKFGEE